ncbi:MAG TPA: hypothetical protein VHV55_04605 [Pirellulales bacterium]|nr:hypothetical protein [Pirellulales bacterium]
MKRKIDVIGFAQAVESFAQIEENLFDSSGLLKTTQHATYSRPYEPIAGKPTIPLGRLNVIQAKSTHIVLAHRELKFRSVGVKG